MINIKLPRVFAIDMRVNDTKVFIIGCTNFVYLGLDQLQE